jgi:hypothetical protein
MIKKAQELMYNGVMKKTRHDIGGHAVPFMKGREEHV